CRRWVIAAQTEQANPRAQNRRPITASLLVEGQNPGAEEKPVKASAAINDHPLVRSVIDNRVTGSSVWLGARASQAACVAELSHVVERAWKVPSSSKHKHAVRCRVVHRGRKKSGRWKRGKW